VPLVSAKSRLMPPPTVRVPTLTVLTFGGQVKVHFGWAQFAEQPRDDAALWTRPMAALFQPPSKLRLVPATLAGAAGASGANMAATVGRRPVSVATPGCSASGSGVAALLIVAPPPFGLTMPLQGRLGTAAEL